MARHKAAAAERSCGLEAGVDNSSADDLSCGSRSILKSRGSSFNRARFAGPVLAAVRAVAVRSFFGTTLFLVLSRVSGLTVFAGVLALVESSDFLVFLAGFLANELTVGEAA